MARREPIKSETQSVVISGSWLAYRLFPLGDGMGVVFRDVTARKRAEQQRDLLIKELHHRVNNTLATVQAIAAQTFRNSSVDAAARKTFEARLLNLSNAHTALTHENWDSVELRELIMATLRPHNAPNGERFSLSGPDMRVQPKSAVALSMAIHELSTNAIKYGALSADGGRVAIDWNVAGERFGMRWQEDGGPPVSPPTRKGFGSIMIERVLAEQLGGGVVIRYDARRDRLHHRRAAACRSRRRAGVAGCPACGSTTDRLSACCRLPHAQSSVRAPHCIAGVAAAGIA